MLRTLLSAALMGSSALVTPAVAGSSAPACAEVTAGQSRAPAPATPCRRDMVARPDGRLSFDSAVVPQRVRTRNGRDDVDLRLARGADGRLRPAASAADVSFSGGDGPLIIVARRGHTMTLSWPGRLPEPRLSGDSATYPAVLPGVDLVVRATRTGFAYTLIVGTAGAAANPALRATRLTVGGDAALSQDLDGTVRTTAAEATPTARYRASGADQSR
jgi:hypothetical protein